jgi:hypothetical protein
LVLADVLAGVPQVSEHLLVASLVHQVVLLPAQSFVPLSRISLLT